MALYKRLISSLEHCSVNEYLDLLHRDYVFIRHQTGEKVSKDDWAPTVTGMFKAMKDGNLRFSENRCIYENDEILIMHNIGSFPDGTKESILVAHTIKDGKILKTESGATPIK
tara:strand:+ start:594 stop:932 length:339 start_codon:yes stop_codon:yes gene_type:complete